MSAQVLGEVFSFPNFPVFISFYTHFPYSFQAHSSTEVEVRYFQSFRPIKDFVLL